MTNEISCLYKKEKQMRSELLKNSFVETIWVIAK
jgi:hypothetical protein